MGLIFARNHIGIFDTLLLWLIAIVLAFRKKINAHVLSLSLSVRFGLRAQSLRYNIKAAT